MKTMIAIALLATSALAGASWVRRCERLTENESKAVQACTERVEAAQRDRAAT